MKEKREIAGVKGRKYLQKKSKPFIRLNKNDKCSDWGRSNNTKKTKIRKNIIKFLNTTDKEKINSRLNKKTDYIEENSYNNDRWHIKFDAK